ncbi:unnamed protein product [Linum trigynum]|uniref:Ionotropic glutamate receptor C-terminal domain-containing protein n=1 Tax=Linum trigynum TaxID=586398 RepID=A0AAV2C942_9ROSI
MALETGRRRWWFRFFVATLFAATAVGRCSCTNNTTAVNVGVILDLKRTDFAGQVWLSCVEMAVSEFYASHPNYTTRVVINTRDSRRDDVVQAAASALDLIKNVQVQAILGPDTSMQANFLIPLGEKAQVPIVSFSATSPTLASIGSPYFFRATQNDSTQVNAIAAIVKAFGWRQAVPIYVDDAFGQGIVPSLVDSLEAVDARVPYRSAISPSATDDQIGQELYKLMTMQTRVFIVHMSPDLGPRLFAKAKEVGMMSAGYVWIVTDGIAVFLDSVDPSVVLHSMQGVLGVKPHVPRSKEVRNFRARWKRKFRRDHPEIPDADLNIYGLWAYDATWALAMALEKTHANGRGATTFSFVNNNNVITTSNSTTTDLERIGVSGNGPNLVRELSRTRFAGLSGEFVMEADGQLRASAYEVVNVNGNEDRVVGFWTPGKGGLARELMKNSWTAPEASSTSTSLRKLIWPGDSATSPKGFEIPTNGKRRLRIGVPVKSGFREFVSVTTDSETNETTAVTGYCMDVFEAVVEKLPYVLPFDYVPFANPSGEKNGTYDDLVYQVFSGNLDAVVGDITIIANRSNYVDFTLPYTESGVSMVVPVRPDGSKNAWSFLKPLTWDLWVTTFLFFLFIGFVVWVLEHRVSEDFRGPPSHQAGTSLWFSFSTMAFAQRQNVVSNLARTVVIIWCFVVLIIIQSYTASFTSLLTVQRLQPTVTDMNELVRKGEFVGYQEDTFVASLLKRLGFREDRLVSYDSIETFDSLFKQGKIVAAFDEAPYIKLILAKRCSDYMMIDPTFKTDGFGFVFPKGSPLVPDISRAILNVNDGDEMTRIEEAWFDKDSKCPESSTSSLSSGNQLCLNSFWSLFLIAGVAAVSALCIFAIMFIYEHRKLLFPSEDDLHSNPSLWRRVMNLFKTFDEKDLNFHTFRDDRVGNNEVHLVDLNVMASPSTFSVETTEFPAGLSQTPSTPPLDSPLELPENAEAREGGVIATSDGEITTSHVF